MKFSRTFFIRSVACPVKEFQSGLTTSILSDFCVKYKIQTKVEDLKAETPRMLTKLEKFPFDSYKMEAKKNKESKEFSSALKWINTCQKMNSAKIEASSGESKSEGYEPQLPKYFVLDLETSTKNVNHKIANCFDARNYVAMPGWLDYKGFIMVPTLYGTAKDFQFTETPSERIPHKPQVRHRVLPPLDHYDIIVGHNLKFDLTYLWGDPELQLFLRRGGKIWDTMYAEYLLEGQLAVIPKLVDAKDRPVEDLLRKSRKSGILTLDTVAPKYGGSKKIDLVKKAWDEKLETSDIPLEILSEYLMFDLKNTETVFLKQLARAEENKSKFLIENRMDYILAICETESNGVATSPFENPKKSPGEDEEDKSLESYISPDSLFRPDAALILTASSEELVSFRKFMNHDAIHRLFFTNSAGKYSTEDQLRAVSRYSQSQAHPNTKGEILCFSWSNLEEKCLRLLLALFDGVQAFTSANSPESNENLEDRLQNFQKMCSYFVMKNDEISLEKHFTKLLMTMKEREVKHFLRRVIFCLPTHNYIAFEENPYFKDRRFASKYLSAFDMKSIEGDVLKHFVASVAHICYGKIVRNFLYRPELVHDTNAPWTQPDMCIELEDSSKHSSTKIPNRYDDEAQLILCSTEGLWIDVMKDESGETRKSVTDDVTEIMQEAFQEYCRIFDNFRPVLGESQALSDFVKDPLKVEVKTLTEEENLA